MKASAIGRVVRKERVKNLVYLQAYRWVSSPLLWWPGESDLKELAMDIVSEAVCKTITGERTWNPSEHIAESGLLSQQDESALIGHLLGAIKSIADNRNKNIENKLNKVALDTPQAAAKAAAEPSAQSQLEADEFYYGLLVELGDDEVCCKIVGLCYDQRLRPDDAIAQLDLTDSERHAANKRLKRKARTYLQKLRSGG